MGLLDNLFAAVGDAGPQPTDLTPNVANKVAVHLRCKWPELVGITGLWFSGSQVHAWVRGLEPKDSSDTDIFALAGAAPIVSVTDTYDGRITTSRTPQQELVNRLGLRPSQVSARMPPLDKPHYEPDGVDISHPRGAIDFWTSTGKTVVEVLSRYPRTHSHARCAFSFTEGLVVLPNEVGEPNQFTPAEDIAF